MSTPTNAMRGVIGLSASDFVAKTLNFLTFVYLARVLGASSYGILEFALALLTYFSLVADGGLEIYATREVAKGNDVATVVAQIVPLKLALALGAFVAMLVLLPLVPDYPGLRLMLVLFGLTLFAQAASLKWVFLGQQRVARLAAGLLLSQLVFTAAVVVFVHDPLMVVWVPVLRLGGELVLTAYFTRLYAFAHGRLRLAFTLRGVRSILQPAFTIGLSNGLGLASYNLDSVLLGIFLGPTAVGWYSAAYRPVTAAIGIPVSYFLGLFPVLSRIHAESPIVFHQTVARSLKLTSIFAVPIGVGGTFLAAPIIGLLFGSAYANAVPALQLLCWSAVLVILRGNYRQALNAAGRSGLDLRCAGTATALNLCLNLFLIPLWGMVGAAVATVLSESAWLLMATSLFKRHVAPVNLLHHLWRPIVAAFVMGLWLLAGERLFWMGRAAIGVFTYFAVLFALGESEVRSWARVDRLRRPFGTQDSQILPARPKQ